MKKYTSAVYLVVGALLLGGCTTTPEMAAPAKPVEPPVTETEAVNAILAADEAISAVKQRKNLWRDTQKIFAKAEKAMSEKKFRETLNLANKARGQAEAALAQSYHNDASFLIDTLRKDYNEQMNVHLRAQLDAAESALYSGQEKMAYEMASDVMAKVRMPIVKEPEPAPPVVAEPKPEPKLNSYNVTAKDNLWDIAAKPEVYGNADMWPLLWKSNKDKIKKPDAIPVGITLTIDRNASDESVAAAIHYSKLRGAKSLGPVEAFDQKFIGK